MPNPADKPDLEQALPLNWSVLPAAGVCLLLIFVPEARNLHETAGLLIVLTVVALVIGMRLAPKDASRATRPALTVGSCLILVVVGAVLTALFWYRAWTTLPSVWGARSLMMWTQIIGFWWPGVLFAALCRHVSEGFAPASRGRFAGQLCWGGIGAVIGLALQIMVLGIREGWS